MRESERIGATLREWLIEEDTEEHRERVFFRNGRYYYENTETEEFILIGEWSSEPSGHEWVSPHSLIPSKYTNVSGERDEFLPPVHNLQDSMNDWSPDPSLVFPFHWLCQVCNLHNPHAHDTCQSCERASRVPRPPRLAGDATLTTTTTSK
jgi:hypothetical protein